MIFSLLRQMILKGHMKQFQSSNLISSYTFGIYPRSEELIEATRKNTENLDSLSQSETVEYISAQKNADLGFVSDPLLKWDDVFRPFANLSGVTPTALNRIYEDRKSVV